MSPFPKILLLFSFFTAFSSQQLTLKASNSLYYEEKYFRFLSNNYETIDQGIGWSVFNKESGVGFKAAKDFGSAVILKDWSMYSFKLIKVVFRPYCSFTLEDGKSCDAEMWLYHTKDNGYFPPGRRIFLKANYFVIIVPFKKVENSPSVDQIFDFLQLGKFKSSVEKNEKIKVISPSKPVKLYQIIQNQPSYLFEGKLPVTEEECLYMAFSQFHYISKTDFDNLEKVYNKFFEQQQSYKLSENNDIEYYRNWQDADVLKPKVTLLSYASGKNLKVMNFFLLLMVTVIVLF